MDDEECIRVNKMWIVWINARQERIIPENKARKKLKTRKAQPTEESPILKKGGLSIQFLFQH